MANIDSRYLIYKDGTMIYAKNGFTGAIDFKGTDARTIIQDALNNLTSSRSWKEKVSVLGSYTIDNTLGHLFIPDYTHFTLFGRMKVKDKTKSLIELGNQTTIENGVYDGIRGTSHDPSNSTRLIFATNKYNVTIRDSKVVNGYGKGIQIDYPYNNVLENVIVYNCKRNLVHHVNADDLLAHKGVCYMRNIISLNAIENGLDGTSPNLYVDGYYSRNCRVSIAMDGWKNIVLENIDVDGGINISTTDAIPPRIGVRAVLNKIFAQGIFVRSKSPYQSLTIDNAYLTGAPVNGIEIVINSNNNLEYVKVSNTEVIGAAGRGIYLRRENDIYKGIFKNIILDNFIARDCGTFGAIFSHVDYLQMNNSVVRGNNSKGFVIENCNYVKIANSNSIVKGLHTQECPLYVTNTNHLKVVNCFLENGGIPATIVNVSDYDFDGCQGSFPILRKIGTALMPAGDNIIKFAHGMAGTPKITLGYTHAEVADATVSSDVTNMTIKVAKPVTADRRIFWFANVRV